ncbi:MAG: cellulase family glycosylhydrolase [Candidatus Eremiobacteraeota bacterium]|nr:cellulase family glycosylhydrolase [Candidatus Eremiobacteraeota bacterium]
MKNHIFITKTIILILFYICCLMVTGCNSDSKNTGETEVIPPVYQFNPLGENNDWQAQDHPSSLAVESVIYSNGNLILDTNLIGEDSNYASGEVYLNMRFVPGLESKVPINMSGRKMKITVKVPSGFIGNPDSPNGVQAFVKDSNWKSQYSKWENITRIKGKLTEYTVSITPITTGIPEGYVTDEGFDPTGIAIIGVKFGIGRNSSHTYKGPLYVTGVEIDPPIETISPPELPESTTSPSFSPGDIIEARSDGIYLNGKKWFIIGTNWRILEYGQNFGATDWFFRGNGVSKHQNYVKQYMEYLSRSGVKVIRVFLLTDGRSMFDREGHVVGYDDIFKNDVNTLLSLAESNGLKVEFVLLDYLIAGKEEEVNGVWLRGRSKIITDSTLRNEFINNFLVPFLTKYGNHPSVIGFDLMNEPEWIISKEDGGGWEDYSDFQTKAKEPISIEQINQFLSQCISNIDLHTQGKLITVGVSCPFHGLLKDLNITHYGLHHYPWMENLNKCIAALPVGKPWILEEFPTRNTNTGAIDYYNKSLDLKGSGAYFWNYRPNSDDSTVTWDNFNILLEDIRDWVDEHTDDIHKKK